jgi:hypothetical protein
MLLFYDYFNQAKMGERGLTKTYILRIEAASNTVYRLSGVVMLLKERRLGS